MPIISAMGKSIAAKNPARRLPSAAEETKPTTVGPQVQPRSPASASIANRAVPPLGMLAEERLNTPGHIIPTEKPQRPQPMSERAVSAKAR